MEQLLHIVLVMNFVSVLFLKEIVRSQRIFSLSNKLKISKLGEVLFNHDRKCYILQSQKSLIQVYSHIKIYVAFKAAFSDRFSFHQPITACQKVRVLGHSHRRGSTFSWDWLPVTTITARRSFTVH